ncbi:MAG: DUF493 domain-containing protein [Melioribacteraceae bacterium]|nr:DUF493 domain-containing protein [Melioribacteraceae bacterium]
MILGENTKKPVIKYPCLWTYKMIGNDVEKMIDTVEMVIVDRAYEIIPSNVSKNNKYFSLSLKINLNDDNERQFIFETLQNAEHIKIVL